MDDWADTDTSKVVGLTDGLAKETVEWGEDDKINIHRCNLAASEPCYYVSEQRSATT